MDEEVLDDNVNAEEEAPEEVTDAEIEEEGESEGGEQEAPAEEEVITIDGLRVEYPDGFGLMRPSNTTPVIVLRFEANSEAALKRIQNTFRDVILKAAPQAKLPF